MNFDFFLYFPHVVGSFRIKRVSRVAKAVVGLFLGMDMLEWPNLFGMAFGELMTSFFYLLIDRSVNTR